MAAFSITGLALGGGQLGICPLPGRDGDYAADLAQIIHWAPALVLTMTTMPEMAGCGAASLGPDLAGRGIRWRHLPVPDFEADSPDLRSGWPMVSAEIHDLLAGGHRVLAHCMGGCGRSGMVLLRLMVERGEAPEAALARLRAVRPCAVETKAQQSWAGAPFGD